MSDIDAPLAWRMAQDGYHMQINQLHKEKATLERRIDELCEENEKLRKLFTDFWKWADPPFALKSGTYEQFMEICDRAHELGLLEIGA